MSITGEIRRAPSPQPADDQVDEIKALKRQPTSGETTGARIMVWLIEADEVI